MQTREDEVKGRGKLGKSHVHEAVEGGMKRTGRMLPDPSPGSPAGKCDKKPLPGKPREGALPALPIPPTGVETVCQHDLLAVIKAHKEDVTISHPIVSLFQGGSRMSLSLTRVLDFRGQLSCLSSYSRKLWEEAETDISPTLSLSPWDSPNILQIILQNKYQCVSPLSALFQHICTECLVWAEQSAGHCRA